MYLLPPKSRFCSSVGNGLFNSASLDLQFAKTKSLVDATTGAQLVTFTRASSGTFVGSDGLVRSAVTNLVLRSEEFETTWANTESTEASNVETAPNGTLTADKLIPDVGVTSGQFRQDVSKAATATIYTCSVYGKAAEFNRLSIRVEHNGSTGNRADVGFSLSNGSVVSAATALGTFSDASATATSVSAGWYRFTLSFTSSTETSLRVRLFGFDSSLPCNGTSGIYLWGAQLEQSSTVGEYIPTTSTINSAPRFDHNPTTGESLGLLVEEARTNLLLRSEEFDNASWGKNNVTVTANVAIAPDGTTTADKLIADNGIAVGSTRLTQSITKAAAATTYTLSVFAKTGDVGTGSLQLVAVDSASIVNNAGATFSTTLGTITVAAAPNGLFSAASATITPFANDWYRCTLTFTTSIETSIQARLLSRLPAPGDGTSGIYLWGAQLEAGAFPTSYIPTTTATVTRSADVASISGSNFSSWYRQDEGTVFNSVLPRGSNVAYSTFSDGTSSNRFQLYAENNGVLLRTSASGSAANNSIGNQSVNLPLLVAYAYGSGGTAASLNGGSSTSTTQTLPTTNSVLGIGQYFASTSGNSICLRRLTYWPTRLPNSTLQSITQ
jgi:hypothetical protein